MLTFTGVIAGGLAGAILAAILAAVLIYKFHKKGDEGYILGQQTHREEIVVWQNFYAIKLILCHCKLVLFPPKNGLKMLCERLKGIFVLYVNVSDWYFIYLLMIK